MSSGNRVTVTLHGGVPWGFRLQGGGNFPLEVAKVRKKSKAHEFGLQEGDVILSINRVQVSGGSHQSAMDIVDMASDRLDIEVSRGGSSSFLGQLDPQRQLRVSPAMNGPPQGRSPSPGTQLRVSPAMNGVSGRSPSPGVTSKSSTSYRSPDGSFKRDVQTEEFHSDVSGRKVTRIVTQEHVTQVKSPVMWQSKGVSPSPSPIQFHTVQVGAQTKKSPLMWQPSDSSTPIPAEVQVSVEIKDSKQLSPQVWQPKESLQSQSASQFRTTNMQEQTTTSYKVTPAIWQPKSISPIPESYDTYQARQMHSVPSEKENIGPPAEPSHRTPSPAVPMFKVKNVLAEQHQQQQQEQSPSWQPKTSSTSLKHEEVVFDMYPKFEVPTPTWSLPKESKSVAVPVQQVSVTGKIPPPPPPPPPPPVPPKPYRNPKIRAWHPTFASSTPYRQISVMEDDELEEMPESDLHPYMDHLPVFAPRVNMGYDDSGIQDDTFHDSPHARHRSLSMDGSDTSSALLRSKYRKLYSDSAFYDDPVANFPTIQEQISMCKRIAQSLTSAANRKARGAKMFARRKRKSSKWIHEGAFSGFSSEYSSTPGDVANLNDLISELDPHDGGSRPLFSFRIPSIKSQVNEPQKMSLSQNEFERMRLGQKKCEHNAVSPQDCFTIAADLHSSRNRGARLFQKRAAKAENWVVDDSNARKAAPKTSKLEEMLHYGAKPQTSPWDAASGNPYGSVQAAFDDPMKNKLIQQAKPPTREVPMPPMPVTKQHSLLPENEQKLLDGGDYNRTAKGWGMSSGQPRSTGHRSPTHYQPDRSSPMSPSMMSPQSPQPQQQQQQVPRLFGDYNPKLKAWKPPEDSDNEDQVEYGSLRRKQHISQHNYANATQNYSAPQPFLPSCDL